jgi:hypothetical protein
MYKVEMSLCKNYYGKVFAHLTAAFGIASVSAEYVNILPIFAISGSRIAGIIILFGVTLLTLIGIFYTAPGILKYILFIAFALLIGQSIKPLVKKLEDNNRLVRILLTTMGIFLGMTALGFYDSQNILGFGPYLFMGLVGLILVNILLYVVTTPEQRKELQINYYTDLFGIVLFTIYIAYDTQIIKENARTCKSQLNRGVQPDYPKESLGLFLDVINLFTHLASANN